MRNECTSNIQHWQQNKNIKINKSFCWEIGKFRKINCEYWSALATASIQILMMIEKEIRVLHHQQIMIIIFICFVYKMTQCDLTWLSMMLSWVHIGLSTWLVQRKKIIENYEPQGTMIILKENPTNRTHFWRKATNTIKTHP